MKKPPRRRKVAQRVREGEIWQEALGKLVAQLKTQVLRLGESHIARRHPEGEKKTVGYLIGKLQNKGKGKTPIEN